MDLLMPLLVFTFVIFFLTAIRQILSQKGWFVAGIGALTSLAATVYILVVAAPQ